MQEASSPSNSLFDQTTANEIAGGPSALQLLWLNPATGKWELAVDGNSDGGLSAHFVLGAYNSTQDFHLGYYGLDTSTDTVWAVINHNSDFGAGNPLDAPVATPEPSTWAMLIGGLGMLAFWRTRKRNAHI